MCEFQCDSLFSILLLKPCFHRLFESVAGKGVLQSVRSTPRNILTGFARRAVDRTQMPGVIRPQRAVQCYVFLHEGVGLRRNVMFCLPAAFLDNINDADPAPPKSGLYRNPSGCPGTMDLQAVMERRPLPCGSRLPAAMKP